MTASHSLLSAVVFLSALASFLLVADRLSSICRNDSGGGGGKGDGEYAPVLLVGGYKMKVDSTNEQVSHHNWWKLRIMHNYYE